MRLILLRHAKSDWDTDAPTDHERPLNNRGRRDAPQMGRALRARGWIPDRVLCSDAARTQETWRRMAPHLAPDADLSLHPELYLCHAAVPLALIEQHRGGGTLMIVGHNPTTEELVPLLCGERHGITTCNAVLLEEAGGAWRLEAVLRPRELA